MNTTEKAVQTRYTDDYGRTWSVRVSLSEAMRFRTDLDFDLLSEVESENGIFDRLDSDIVLAGAMLWICCRDQAERAPWTDSSGQQHTGVAEASFFLAHGECFDSAKAALFQALVNFIPSHQRQQMQTLLVARQTAMRLATSKTGELLSDLDIEAAITKAIDKELAKARTRIGQTSGDSSVPLDGIADV